MPAGRKSIVTLTSRPEVPEADISIGIPSLGYIFIGCLVIAERLRDESSQSPSRTGGRGNRSRNQRHARRRAEGSKARGLGRRQRSARAAGHETRSRFHQHTGIRERAEGRDQGARACFWVYSARADRAAATSPVA